MSNPLPESTPAPGRASSAPVPQAKRLLILKFGAIGDVVMAIPAAARMRDLGFQVDWVASEAVAPVLQLYPWIHVLPVKEAALLRGRVLGRLAAVARLWRTLRVRVAQCGPYNTIATLYYDRRYALLVAPLRAERKLQLSRTDRRFVLLPGRHHTDEYERILTGRPDGETPYQLRPVPVPALPAPVRPVSPGRARVVLVPAGARNVLRDDALRRWPIENYVALAETLVAAGCEVLLAGGPDDRWASPFFGSLKAQAAPDAFADLIGSLSLVESLAVLHSAAVTVTHDTGPLHLAGLTSTGIVTLFGPTDPRGRLPQRENSLALWGGEGFACRPCYDGRDYAPCQHNGCLAQITVPMAAAQVFRLLEAGKQGHSLAPEVIAPPHSSAPAAAQPGHLQEGT